MLIILPPHFSIAKAVTEKPPLSLPCQVSDGLAPFLGVAGPEEKPIVTKKGFNTEKDKYRGIKIE